MSHERCTFCRIVTGEQPAHVVLDDGESMAFLDHRPLFPGHVLLVPREHHVTIADLPQASIAPFFSSVQLVAGAVERAMGAQGTFVAINNRVSQSVPHLHAHIVPRTRGDGLRGFFWPRTRYAGDEHMAEVRQRIRDALRG